MEKSNLSVVLQLTALFGGAAAEAATELDKIADKVDEVGKKGSVLAGLSESVGALKERIEGVNSALSVFNTNAGNMTQKTTQAAQAARQVKDDLGGVAKSAKKAAEDVDQAAKAVDNLGKGASKVAAVAEETAKVAQVSEAAKNAFAGLLGMIDQTQRGNFSPLIAAARQLEGNVLRAKNAVAELNAEMMRAAQYAAGMTRPELVGYSGPVSGQGVGEALRAARRETEAQYYRNSLNIPLDVGYSTRSEAAYRLGDSRSGQMALPGGAIFESEFREIAAGFRRIQAEARAAAAAAGQFGIRNFDLGGQSTARSGVNPSSLPGDFGRNAIVPYTFQGSAEDAAYAPPGADVPNAKYRKTRAGDFFNSGRTFNGSYEDLSEYGPAGFDGPSLDSINAAERAEGRAKSELTYKRGDRMQSLGYAGIVNAMMIGGVLMPAFQSQMTSEQLDNQNEIAARANGATPQTVQYLASTTHAIAPRNGGQRNDSIAATNAYIGSMSPSVEINNNDWQKTMAYALDRISKLSIISTAGGAPISQATAAEGVNRAIANMGYDTSSPKALGQATEQVSNMLAKMKNVTPSGIPDTLNFLRAVGPVAALDHQSPEDMAGLIYALGKGKMIGGPAGNAVKRLFQRETLPTRKTTDYQAYMKEKTGVDLDLYDSKGNARSALDVLGQFADSDKQHHYSQKTKSMVIGQLSGLYANSQIGQVVNTLEQHGGSKGIRQMGSDILHKGIAGSKKDAVESEYGAQAKSLGVTTQKAAATVGEAWAKAFKDAEPMLIKLAEGVSLLANIFEKIPGPIQTVVVDFALLATGLMAANGIFNVFGGNTLKMIGGMGKLAIETETGTALLGPLMKGWSSFTGVIGDAAKSVLTFVDKFVATRVIAPIFNGMTMAARAFGAAIGLDLLPAIAVIALVAAAAALLYVAWNANFMGVRNIVASAMKDVQGWLQAADKTIRSWEKNVWSATEGVRKAFQALWDGVVGVIKGIDNALGGWGQKAIGAISSLASEAEKNAKKAGDALHKHLGEGARAAGGEVEKLKKQFGGMADSAKNALGFSTSTAKGNPGSDGAAYSDSNAGETPTYDGPTTDLSPGLSALGGKSKKSKITLDVPVKIGDISASEIEDAARRIEAQWKNAHKIGKPQWVDLQDSSGNVVDRLFGDPKAFQQAAKNLLPDKGLKQAVYEYVEIAKFLRTGTEKEIADLEQFLAKAKTQGVQAYIKAQIAAVNQVQLKQIGKISETFKTNHNAIYGDDGSAKTPTGGIIKQFNDTSGASSQTIEDANKSYRELLHAQKEGIITATELKERYNLLYTEEKSLTTDQEKMAQDITDVNARLAAQSRELEGLTGNTRAAREARAALTSEMTTEQSSLAKMNTDLAQQAVQLGNVTVMMNKANFAYEKQIQYQKTLSYQLDLAKQKGQEGFYAQGGSMLASGGSSLVSRLMSDTTGRGNGGAIGQLISGYVNNYMQTAAAPLFKSIMGGDKSSTPQPITDTQGNQLHQIGNTSLATIASNATQQTSALNSLVANSKVTEGMKQNPDGSMPVGTVATTVSANSNSGSVSGIGPVANGAAYAASIDAAYAKRNIFNSNTAKSLSKVGGALASTYAGAQEGGIAGGMTAGIGTLAATGNPYAAGVAAIIGYIGIGSKATPATSPDIYDTQAFGQAQANMIGSGYNGKAQEGANGSYFTEDNATAQATNNMGMLQNIQQWAANNIHNSDASIAKQAQDDVAKYGKYDASITDPNKLIHYDKNIGNEAIIGGTEAGNWQQLSNDMTIATQQIASLGSAAQQAALNAKALADSFTSSIYGGPSGFSIPYLGSVGGGNASSSFLPTGSASVLSSARNPDGSPISTAGVNQTVNVRILEGATVSNSDEVIRAIQDVMPQITAAVNQNNYDTGRYAQSYQSQLS